MPKASLLNCQGFMNIDWKLQSMELTPVNQHPLLDDP